jgi:hypothetical protein
MPAGVSSYDRMVMEALVEHGADLSQPREIVYRCYAASREGAEALAAAARTGGFAVEIREPLREYPGQWPVVCRVYGVLSPELVATNGVFFARSAASHGAEYDGWEAAVQPAAP